MSQHPYRIQFKDRKNFTKALLWLLDNYTDYNLLWKVEFSEDNTLAFSLERDAVIMSLRFQ